MRTDGLTQQVMQEIIPKNVDALSYKGGSLHELGKSDDAMKCFDTALEDRCKICSILD